MKKEGQVFEHQSLWLYWDAFHAKEAGKTYMYKIQGADIDFGNLEDIRRDLAEWKWAHCGKKNPKVLWMAKIATVLEVMDV